MSSALMNLLSKARGDIAAKRGNNVDMARLKDGDNYLRLFPNKDDPDGVFYQTWGMHFVKYQNDEGKEATTAYVCDQHTHGRACQLCEMVMEGKARHKGNKAMEDRIQAMRATPRYLVNVSNHPAFGMVSVNRIHSTGTTLFASDLRHAEIIELEIYEGQMVERDGVQNPARATRRPITSISLSSSQWATLVCSFGLGEGVPCTLNRTKTGDSVRIPPIKRMESTRQRFDRNIEEAAQRQLANLAEDLQSLRTLMAKGKAGKRELEELYRSMSAHLGNLPKNLSFSTQLIQESMDSIVSAGKAELEASAVGVALRLGIKEIGRLTGVLVVDSGMEFYALLGSTIYKSPPLKSRKKMKFGVGSDGQTFIKKDAVYSVSSQDTSIIFDECSEVSNDLHHAEK